MHGGGDRGCCNGMSDRCSEGEPGLSDWEAVGDRTEIQGKPGFLGSAAQGSAEKSNTSEKPAQITMIMQIINTSPYLLIVLNNENILLCVLIVVN